jgi:integrase
VVRYLKTYVDQNGRPRNYVRLPNQKLIPIPVGKDHAEFWKHYSAALNGQRLAEPNHTRSIGKSPPGSFRALCAAYIGFLSKDKLHSERTVILRRRHLEAVCRDVVSPDDPTLVGDLGVEELDRFALQKLIDRKRETPAEAKARRATFRALFAWAVDRGEIEDDPSAKTKPVKYKTEGYKTWTLEHVARFVARFPFGTKPHLAMSLLLYTGQRMSDVVRFGRQHIKSHVDDQGQPYRALHFVQAKNSLNNPKKMVLPIHPDLETVLDTAPKGQLAFILSERKKPFEDASFSNWFSDRCEEAGLKGYSAHGLRKTLLTIGARSRLTLHELMALAGHSKPETTMIYTRQSGQEDLALSGMAKLSSVRFENKSVSSSIAGPKGETKTGKKSNENKG